MARRPRSLADRAEAVVRRAHEREELARREFQLTGWKYWAVLGGSIVLAVVLAVGGIYAYMRFRPHL